VILIAGTKLGKKGKCMQHIVLRKNMVHWPDITFGPIRRDWMRLTKISTRTGDNGTTGLADGSRISKDHERIAVLGSIDELNSHIGVLLVEDLPLGIDAVLLHIQSDLFDLGGALALPDKEVFPQGSVRWLDEHLLHYNEDLPPLREFVLPGGSRAGALCHVARTVARRAERDLVILASCDEAVPQYALQYLNRLSDLLFVFSRCINRITSATEPQWNHTR
jgi:cob(I)alamin adenosyltransferase